MAFAFEPGDLVETPDHADWGLGQVQSVIGERITVNFEHRGKIVILSENIRLIPVPHGRN
ncbi:MAG: DUF3553 domain-containing protein [Rhodobacteraceae bacterium]|nr:DUF3553 domain-containing protein [Paracoccaceae bacterium]MCB1367576.1 DUF3553 domain-containing protein [Paracoccaceae bacterium]